ncbi:MAG: ABC transporter ATP-binding protein [Rikenellaceae bacterium]
MFKTYIKLLGFASPLSVYAVPYFIYAVLYAIFNTFNYAMIIPILKTMFLDGGFSFTPVHEFPDIAFNADTYYNVINYLYTTLFGVNFEVQNMLILLAVITVMMSLLSNTFRYLCACTVEKLRANTLQRVRNRLFDHVMGMNVGFFSEQRKGDIISKITGDVGVVQFCITNTLQVAFREPFLVIGYLTAMISISWQLSIFSALFLPMVALVIGSIVKRLRHPAKKSMELGADLVSTLDESLSGVKIIKSYNATDYIKEKYHQVNRRVTNLTLSMARRQQLASPTSEVLGITAIGIIIVFGGGLVAANELDAAQFLAFVAIFSQITRPVRSFIDQFANINQGVAAGDRILGLLAEPNPLQDEANAKELTQFKERIEFRDVHFSYDGTREVLTNVNFTIEKGQTVALVGPSGGGKSTLSELIPRFYDPTKGEILIDGVSLRDFTQESIRKHIGTVAQDTILFNDTIFANLAFGKLGATKEEVVEAAKIANADNFIMESLDGYDSNIGDRGMKLSGGQRQRLSIARAVLKNPDILILDEATSALDTESEKLVQESLTKLLKGRTSVVIAHRLSTIYNADKIVVVDRGTVAEEGTHSELMARRGIYSKLVEMQSFE